MIPGEYILGGDMIEANTGRKTLELTVANTGDRPVQVGSHFHFFEVNRALEFNRAAAVGMRLNIPAGTAVRFEPGEEKDVILVDFGGIKKVYGLNNLTNGSLRPMNRMKNAVEKAVASGFKNSPGENPVKTTSKEVDL